MRTHTYNKNAHHENTRNKNTHNEKARNDKQHLAVVFSGAMSNIFILETYQLMTRNILSFRVSSRDSEFLAGLGSSKSLRDTYASARVIARTK